LSGVAAANVAIVGGGQSARWLLFALAEQLATGRRFLHGGRVTVISDQAELGTGLAWSRRNVLDDHLTSVAAPIGRGTYGDRQQQQFRGIVGLLEESGVAVSVLSGREAVEARPSDGASMLRFSDGSTLTADAVVLATGYGTRGRRGKALAGTGLEEHPAVHDSPWPATALQAAVFERSAPVSDAHPKHVLILGTYLNGIDAALSLGLKAGRFETDGDGRLHYRAPAGFRMVLASRLGQLPKVWGRAQNDPPPLRWFTEERLSAALVESAPFLPIDTALALLSQELSTPAGASEPPSRTPDLRRVEEWGAGPARGDRADALRRDIAAVMTSGRPFGTYADTRACWWQAPIDDAIKLWSESSPYFCAEDQRFFDDELRTTFFNHMLPMTLDNALQIEAMMRAGRLEVVALGRTYDLRPAADGSERMLLSYVDEDGAPRASAFTDVVDATGQRSDLGRHGSPLLASMVRAGTIQAPLRAFRDPADGPAYSAGGGIFVNPHTCHVVPQGSTDMRHSGGSAVYAMGPNLSGQFVDAQSLGQVQRDARRIAAHLCAQQHHTGGDR
jgi:uncharacterized NAD(P)/FAD-binding protein YdhS